MTRRSDLHPAITLAIALGLTAPLAACREIRPAANDVTTHVLAAAESPRPSHVRRTSALTITLPLAPAQSISMTMQMDAEQWTRNADHVRTESSLRLAPPPGTESATSPEADIRDQRLTTIINGERAVWHSTADNTYQVLDGALTADGLPPAAEPARADVLRAAMKDIVAGYHLNPLLDAAGDPEIAGRPVYALVVIPRNATVPRLVANAFRISRAVITVDRETYDILAIDGTGTVYFGADAAPLDALGFGVFADALSGVVDQAVPMAISMRTTEYELAPSLPDERFAFVPPDGAAEIDPSAMASRVAARGEANALATLAAASALVGDPSAARLAARPESAEALLAGNALRAIASNAGFGVVFPGFLPSGCAVSDSGRLPDAPTADNPSRFIWLTLACPSGTLRIEEKSADDTSLDFDEADAKRETVTVGGDRATAFRGRDGINALVLTDHDGTSVKVSGSEDVAILALIAASMQ